MSDSEPGDVPRPWLATYPAEIPSTINPRHTSVLGYWDELVDSSPDSPIIHYFDDTLTVARLDGDVNALAAWLSDVGVAAGDRVAVYLQNDPHWLTSMLACWRIGAIAVAVNPMLKSRELAKQLADCSPEVVVCLDELVPTVEEAVDEAGLSPSVLVVASPGAVGGTTEHTRFADVLADRDGARVPRRTPPPDEPAMLTYTSGTTGASKGAVNTHGNIVHSTVVYERWLDVTADDVILGVAPLFHVTGLVAHMAIAAVAGAPLVLFHRFDPAEALRLIERWRVTFTMGSITVFVALMSHPNFDETDLSSLRCVASGGAPISPAIVQRFEDATGAYILSVYGLTETTSPSHLTPPGLRAPIDPGTGALSVGLPVSDADVWVVDPQTREPMPIGEPGEIVIAGPMIVPEYWGKPAETQHAIPAGRLHTGDIGFMNDEGRFWLIDRSKDQINAAGYKVWPREVEDVLYEHEAVREAAVVGMADGYRGETVVAFVSLRPGMSADPEELVDHCRQRLAAYKYPRRIDILEELPKTASGKIMRRVLRDGGDVS